MASKDDKPPEIPIFCDARDMSYWFQVGGRFLKMGARDLKMHLAVKFGLRPDVYFKGIPEILWPLYEAQEKRIVDYAGPLAGHRVGAFKNSSGGIFLVTQQTTFFDEIDNQKNEK